MNAAKWLEDWYASNCDGDREYSYRNTRIGTSGNTGWSLQVNIRDMLEIERTKKRLGLLLVVAMVFLVLFLSGCQRNSDEENSNSTAPRITSVNTYHETIPVPENGWTADLISEVLYINGKNVPFPFTIEDLGEGFEWDIDEAIFKEEELSSITINYHNELFAFVHLYARNESELNSAEILYFDYFYEGNESIICINGITLGNTYDEVAKAFGEIDSAEYASSSLIKYSYEDVTVLFSIKEGEVFKLMIYGGYKND